MHVYFCCRIASMFVVILTYAVEKAVHVEYNACNCVAAFILIVSCLNANLVRTTCHCVFIFNQKLLYLTIVDWCLLNHGELWWHARPAAMTPSPVVACRARPPRRKNSSGWWRPGSIRLATGSGTTPPPQPPPPSKLPFAMAINTTSIIRFVCNTVCLVRLLTSLLVVLSSYVLVSFLRFCLCIFFFQTMLLELKAKQINNMRYII